MITEDQLVERAPPTDRARPTTVLEAEDAEPTMPEAPPAPAGPTRARKEPQHTLVPRSGWPATFLAVHQWVDRRTG